MYSVADKKYEIFRGDKRIRTRRGISVDFIAPIFPRRMKVLIGGVGEFLFGETEATIHGDGVFDELKVDLENGGQLGDGSVLVDRHEDFVKKSFEIIAEDPIHHESCRTNRENTFIALALLGRERKLFEFRD